MKNIFLKHLSAYALACGILAAAFPVAAFPADKARDDDSHEIGWTRFKMDGHRKASGVGETGQKVQSILDGCASALDSVKKVVGRTDRMMPKTSADCYLTNLVSEMIMVQSQKLAGITPDISLTNYKGIRIDFPAGDITVDDVTSLLPFKNYLVILSMKGSALMELFGRMAKRDVEPMGGVELSISGHKVDRVLVGGKPLDPAAEYLVATNDFLVAGGDGIFQPGSFSVHKDFKDIQLHEMLIDYFTEAAAKGQCVPVPKLGWLHCSDVAGDEEEDEHFDTVHCPFPTDARLSIIHTNDVHSHLDPVRSGFFDGCGGAVERAEFIDSVRKADGSRNVLLLDAGDYEQGSFYYQIFGGRKEVEAMNAMRYDVATLGNHSLDAGVQALAKRLKPARFTTVLCNYEFDYQPLQRQLKPYVILRRGGLKIGITGVLTDVRDVVNIDNMSELHYKDPATSINSLSGFLKKKKNCDIVIVLSHCGIAGTPDNPGDLLFAPKLKGVDIVIGGHSHTDLPDPVTVKGADGKPVLIVTDFCWGIYAGELKVN